MIIRGNRNSDQPIARRDRARYGPKAIVTALGQSASGGFHQKLLLSLLIMMDFSGFGKEAAHN
jgi:hypothetical protein